MTSLCTTRALRSYFLEDTLPENGLFCPTDEILFPPKANGTVDVQWKKPDDTLDSYSEEDIRLLENMQALGREIEQHVSDFKRTKKWT